MYWLIIKGRMGLGYYIIRGLQSADIEVFIKRPFCHPERSEGSY